MSGADMEGWPERMRALLESIRNGTFEAFPESLELAEKALASLATTGTASATISDDSFTSTGHITVSFDDSGSTTYYIPTYGSP